MKRLSLIQTVAVMAIGLVGPLMHVSAKQTIGVTSETTEYAGAGKAIEDFHPLGQYLSQVLGQDVTVVFSQDLTRDLQRTRTGPSGR